MHQRTPLEVHALPDSANRPVPALLTVRNLGECELRKEIGVVAWIDDPDNQLVGTIMMERLADVELKGEVSALVLTHQVAVEPDRGGIVYGTKVEEMDTCPPVRHFELPPVPRHTSVVSEIVELRLPRPRDLNRPGTILRKALVGESLLWIRVKIPLPIQTDAFTTHDVLQMGAETKTRVVREI